MTMCDGRDGLLGSGRAIKNTVTIDTDRHRERRKGQGGIPAGGDFRKEIQPEPLELFSRKTLAQRRGERLLSPPVQRRVKFRRGAGSPFQRALPAGELSADSRGSTPPGASERDGGKMLPASPSESATASFDGRRLSKVLLRYFRRK